MDAERFMSRTQETIILGVAASDAHAVANHLIARDLRARDYRVINLGTCTTVDEFADAVREYPDALAVVIGSVNGHVHEDLHDLMAARTSGRISCPVVVGGNLWVGSHHDKDAIGRLYALGVDHVLVSVADLPACLTSLVRDSRSAMGLAS